MSALAASTPLAEENELPHGLEIDETEICAAIFVDHWIPDDGELRLLSQAFPAAGLEQLQAAADEDRLGPHLESVIYDDNELLWRMKHFARLLALQAGTPEVA